MATTTTLKANVKLDNSIAKTYYWHSGGKELCSDHIYANTHANSNKYRSRITFYLSESTFLDQTVISGKLKIKLQTLYSSASKTEKVGVKMSLTGGDTAAAYNEAIFVGEISNFSKENVWFTVDLNNSGISMINQAIKEQDSSINLYFGPPEIASGGDKIYGTRFYGYNYSTASVRPVLDLTHVPSISTGTVTTTTPRIGSPINLTINRNLSTYTHKVEWIIGGKIYHTENSVSTSTSFTPEISKTTDYLGSRSATSISDGTYCKIYTYSSNTQNEETLMGSSEVPFTLHMASNPSIEWSTDPSIESIHPSNYYVSSFSKIKIKGGVVEFLDDSELEGYRFRMNSCGININKTQISSEYTTEILSTNSDTEFKVYVSIKDSRGRYSAEKEIKGTCYSYSSPQLVETNVYRAQNSAGTIIDEMGGYLIVKGKYSYKPIANYNSITSVKVTGANLTFNEITDESYNFSFSSSTLIKPEQSYKITILLEDEFSSNKIEIPVPEGRYLIHIPRGGKGIGLGTTGENNYIKLGWPVKGLEIEADSDLKIFGTDVNSVKSFRDALELSDYYLPRSGGSITGNITLDGVNILNKNGKVVLRTSGGKNGVGDTGEDFYLQAKNLYYTDGNNNSYNVLTDKTTTETLDLTDNFKPYSGTDPDSNNNYYAPGVIVKKTGKIIQIDGAISPTKAGTGDYGEANEIVICELPSGYCPSYSIIQICQGSQTSTWMLRVRPNGKLTFSRYRNGASYAKYDTNTWLTFHVCFIQG